MRIDRSIWLCVLALCVLSPAIGARRGTTRERRLGLSCERILAMKPEDWADYFNQKHPGGEAGYDEAYSVYAGCMKRRSAAALAKLPRNTADRVRRYRVLCGKFRVDSIYVHQAYAGGGSMYTHGANRGVVQDERLVALLVRAFSGRGTSGAGTGIRSDLARIKARLKARDPAVKANRGKLTEYSTLDQGRSAYRDAGRDMADLERLLATERADARRLVLRFLDVASRPFDG